jgi:hypothetical protein
MKCPNCGNEISDNSVFCSECGYPVKKYFDALNGHQQEVQQGPANTYGQDPNQNQQNASNQYQQNTQNQYQQNAQNQYQQYNQNPYQPTPPKKHALRNVLIAVGCVLALIIVIGAVGSMNAKKGSTESSAVLSKPQSTAQTADASKAENQNNNSDAGATESPQATSTAPQAAASTAATPAPTAAPAEVAVAEQELVNEKGIKITAAGFDMNGSYAGPSLKLLIENDSDTDLTVQARSVSINGYMMDNVMLSSEVTAGKKANDEVVFMSQELEDCGITSVADIELSFHIFTTDGWDDYLDTAQIQIPTSVKDTYTQQYDDSGDVIYEEGGIKIVSKGMASENSFLGPGLRLYIQNDSDQSVTVQARDLSINGFMIDTYSLSEEVGVGKKAVTELTLLQDTLNENGITSISDMNFTLHIFRTDDMNTVADTDTITIKM